MTRSTCILLVLLTLMSVLSLFVGAADITPADVLSGDIESLELMLISRLPRLLAILCTGMGMSIAGLIMQQLCANKFVSPTTGATISSAQFGILIALLFFPDSTLWSRALFAFAAAILGTWTFVWFILRMPMKDPVMVPLVGIMFGNVIGGNFELVYLVLPLIVLAWIFAKHFNIVGMGRDFSKNLGVNYTLVLFSGLTIAAMITAAIVSVVGSISYIGLIVPNLIAIFKGDDLRSTLADTALFGALFVLCCDVIGRLVIAPYELPIELIIGTIGSLLFIALIFYRLRFGRMSLDKKQLLRLFGLDRRTPACGGAK